MGEIKFMAGLVMFALFSIAVTTYVFNFGDDNGAVINLSSESGYINLKNEMISNVSYFSVTDMNSSSNAFYTSTLEAGDETMGGGGAFKVGLGTMLKSVSSLFSLTKTYLFGGSNAFGIFLVAIFALLFYTGVRYMYKTWVGKNPD